MGRRARARPARLPDAKLPPRPFVRRGIGPHHREERDGACPVRIQRADDRCRPARAPAAAHRGTGMDGSRNGLRRGLPCVPWAAAAGGATSCSPRWPRHCSARRFSARAPRGCRSASRLAGRSACNCSLARRRPTHRRRTVWSRARSAARSDSPVERSARKHPRSPHWLCWGALIVLFRLTRDYAWHYNLPADRVRGVPDGCRSAGRASARREAGRGRRAAGPDRRPADITGESCSAR